MSIPVSQFVGSTPGVVSAGGSAISLNGLLLTTSTRVPIGKVLSFPSAQAVGTYFGFTSQEYTEAQTYFAGFDNSLQKPAALLVAQYAWASPVGAYLRSGSFSGVTLAQLTAITPGTLTITVDGVTTTSSTITLSAATSFSNAATIIQTALAAAKDASALTSSISGTALTVGGAVTGTIAIGQQVTGTSVLPGTYIVSGSGSSWVVNQSQTVASTTLTFGAVSVTFDSVSSAFVISAGSQGANSTITYASGAIAAALKMDAADGAVLSQGAALSTPAAYMASLYNTTQNFFGFWTTFEPVTADCLAFAGWVSGQNGRVAYVCWDTDATVTAGASPTSFGAQLVAAAYSGTVAVWEPSNQYAAAFAVGSLASLSFNQPNGRTTLAYRTQSGLTPGVTDPTSLANVVANGYNCYAQASLINGTQWNVFWPGSISGLFLWADSYTDQALINSNCQLALMNFLVSVPSVPYNQAGYGQIQDVLRGVMKQALAFGAVRTGVVLSASQVAAVNAQAGKAIDKALTANGYYIQVAPASAQVRAARGSPPVTIWYTDGQSVQQINVASLSVQ